jgi:pimeloyl-ACP methyl ester carboxylesterase
VRGRDVELVVEQAGQGRPVVLVHGLTATRRYVVHGSRLLERSGCRVISYDARGHGESPPAPAREAYEYADLVADLEAVLDTAEVERAALVGVSMGAATTLAAAIEHPERVSALVQVTPAHLGLPQTDPRALERWDSLAEGLEQGGVDGFLNAYGDPPVADRFKGLIIQAIRQRIERHRHPEAVADALRVVPRSRAFDGPDALEEVEPATLVVASRDELDPEHPYAVAEAYEARIRRSELVVEEVGASPLAWRGAQLSKAIVGFLERNA